MEKYELKRFELVDSWPYDFKALESFSSEDEFDAIIIKILKSMERVQKKPKWGIYKKDDITSNDKGEINVKNI